MQNDYFLKCVIKYFCSNDPRLQSKIMREYNYTGTYNNKGKDYQTASSQ